MNMQAGDDGDDAPMTNQARLDALENLIMSTGGEVKVFNLMQFGMLCQELQSIENKLGDMLEQVLELKKELGCTSTLSIVKEGN